MNPFTKPKIAVYMAGIFLAGGLSGGFAGYHLARHQFFRLPPPRNMSEHIMNRFDSDLRLSADQDTQIKPLVEEACNQLHVLHQKAMDDGGRVMSNMDATIILLLTPEQKTKFEEMKRERMGPPKDRKGPPGPRPQGPPPQGDADRPDHKPEPQHN